MSAAPDLFTTAPEPPPAEILAGLKRLAGARPLWPVDREAWFDTVGAVTAFAVRWHSAAAALGWSPVHLYGLSPTAPWARVSAMGVAFLAVRGRYRVVDVSADAIELMSVAGAKLRLRRAPPDPSARLAWHILAPRRRVAT